MPALGLQIYFYFGTCFRGGGDMLFKLFVYALLLGSPLLLHAAEFSVTGETRCIKLYPVGDDGDIPTSTWPKYDVKLAFLYGGSLILQSESYHVALSYFLPVKKDEGVGGAVILESIAQLNWNVDLKNNSAIYMSVLAGKFKGSVAGGELNQDPSAADKGLPNLPQHYITREVLMNSMWYQAEVIKLFKDTFKSGAEVGWGYGFRYNRRTYPMQIAHYNANGITDVFMQDDTISTYLMTADYRLLKGPEGWWYGINTFTLGYGYSRVNATGAKDGQGFGVEFGGGGIYTSDRFSLEYGGIFSYFSGANYDQGEGDRYGWSFKEFYLGPYVKASVFF